MFEIKSKEDLAEIINERNGYTALDALIEYCNRELSKDDVLYLLDSFKYFHTYPEAVCNHNEFWQFYRWYLFLYKIAINENIIEINNQNLEKIDRIISLSVKYGSTHFETYKNIADFYRVLYLIDSEKFSDKKNFVLINYDKAIALGSEIVKEEKQEFLEKYVYNKEKEILIEAQKENQKTNLNNLLMQKKTANMTDSKQKLIDLINTKHDVFALVDYMDQYRENADDIEYFLNAFRDIEKNFLSSLQYQAYWYFWREYIRALAIAIQKKVIENNQENRNKIEEIIQMSLKRENCSSAIYLYAARFYQDMYFENIEGYTDNKYTIIQMFEKAMLSGNYLAAKEKEAFLKRCVNRDKAKEKNRNDEIEEPHASDKNKEGLHKSCPPEKESKTVEDSKQKLIDLIDKEHDVDALIEYMDAYKNDDKDIEYFLQSFQDMEQNYVTPNHPKFRKFYNEYIRMLFIAIKHHVLENNPENREHAKKIISIALDNNPGRAAYLYIARFYNLMYQQHIEEYINQKDVALSYYDKAEKLGSELATKEKADFLNLVDKYEEQLQEKEIKTLNLDYYNADCNLTDLIDTVLENRNQNISMLLYGPENSGMREFAHKLFELAGKNYIFVDATSLSSRLKFQDDMQKYLREYDAFILHHINTWLYEEDRFVDNKDYVLEQNTQYLIHKIKSNKYSFVLVVDDITRLSQGLLDVFPLKIKFDYMNKEQKQSALQNIFYIQSDKLNEVSGFVYDDFKRIKGKADFLHIDDKNQIIEMLKKEADSKPSFLKYSTPVLEFDINLINANTDLVKLTTKLEKSMYPFTMLISGPAGTGKSYYLRYLASKMNMTVIEKTAAELFSKYQGEPAKNVLQLFKEAEEQNAIIILDEVEKITSNRAKESSDSRWRSDMTNAFLTCLENTKYPFMATTNFIADIDKAILRRFVFKLNFDYLKPEQISYAFRHTFNQEPPAELFKIGGLTNGDFALVKKKAQILDCLSDTKELYEMLKEEVSVKAIGKVVHLEKEINYDRNFINIEGNSLDLYIKKIKEEQITNFSLLLHGPSGTGKSLYLRQLAFELGYEIIERRASDLMSKWYGETQQNIAQAFEEAKNRRAMLIFDEIDSFLPSKSGLDHMIDAQVVNEFLVQLENHPYPVGATTNYIDHLERASIRRFKIEAKFDYLKKEQYAYVYRKTFGLEPPKEIENLSELTPAVFALAAEKVSLENAGTDEKRVFEIFLDEVKKSTGKNPLQEEDKTYEQIFIKEPVLYNLPIEENYNKILTGFVKIMTDTGHGSGFFITNDGFILTNKHVVKEQQIVKVELFSGRTVPGEVVRTNSLDIALVKISEENKVYPMPIKTKELNIGSTVFCLGNPGIHNQVLSKGCITRYTTNEDAQRIETDCFMDNGASGGPLLDEYGNVIGINVEGWVKNKIKVGLNMHLSINDALNVLNIKIKS